MPFFTYDQNNSGGSFDHDAKTGIGYKVVVEAVDSDHANSRAEDIGLYFNGCDSGMDCFCCGDRWYESWKDEGEDEPNVKAGWGIPSYIHYLDGTVKEITSGLDKY